MSGQYIVVVNNRISDINSTAEEVVNRFGGEIISIYENVLRGFAVANLDRAVVDSIKENPNVKYIEQDRIGYLNESQSIPPWGLDRIDQRNNSLDDIYNYNFTGQGVNAYVIDSGIRISHDEFENRASYGYDFHDNDSNANDCHGHGTHVAGAIGGETYGVAKEVNLVALKVTGCDSWVSGSDFIDAVDWIAANGVKPDVVNASINFSESSA